MHQISPHSDFPIMEKCGIFIFYFKTKIKFHHGGQYDRGESTLQKIHFIVVYLHLLSNAILNQANFFHFKPNLFHLQAYLIPFCPTNIVIVIVSTPIKFIFEFQ